MHEMPALPYFRLSDTMENTYDFSPRFGFDSIYFASVDFVTAMVRIARIGEARKQSTMLPG